MGQYVVFRLGEEEFGLGIEQVIEILRSAKPNPVPELPDFISGVVTVRGEVVPLVDMRMRFNITPAPQKEREILIRSGKEKIGLIVDEVKGIENFQDNEVTKPPVIFKGLKSRYLLALGRKKDRVVMLINIDNILSSNEKLMLVKSRQDIKRVGEF